MTPARAYLKRGAYCCVYDKLRGRGKVYTEDVKGDDEGDG